MVAQDIGGGVDGGNLAYLDRLYSDCGPQSAISQFHYARVGGRDSKSQILVQDVPFLRVQLVLSGAAFFLTVANFCRDASQV